jgi:hypothetical protein
VGSLVPGPIEPSTQRRCPVEAVNSSATSRAIRTPASESSKIPVRDVVLGQSGVVGAERVCLHPVDADGEVRLVHRAHDVRPRDVEDLVAAFQLLEVVQRRVLGLEHGAHGSVRDHHTGGERLLEGFRSHEGFGSRRHDVSPPSGLSGATAAG